MTAARNAFVDKVQSLLAGIADGKPVVMINLLRYRNQADYGPESDAKPCTGREAYQRYSQETLRFFAAIGAQVTWHGFSEGRDPRAEDRTVGHGVAGPLSVEAGIPRDDQQS